MPEQPGAPFTAYIGAFVDEMSEGHGRLTLVTGSQHADAAGHVHTGVLTSVMDSVIGIALGTLRGEAARQQHGPHATIEMSTSFYSRATPGEELVFEGRVIRITSRVAFGEVETRRASDGEVIAKARLTFAMPGQDRGPDPQKARVER